MVEASFSTAPVEDLSTGICLWFVERQLKIYGLFFVCSLFIKILHLLQNNLSNNKICVDD